MTERVQHAEHRVGQWRPGRGLYMDAAFQRAVGATGDEKRYALVVVLVRVANWRAAYSTMEVSSSVAPSSGVLYSFSRLNAA
jgi:hypothetical protein